MDAQLAILIVSFLALMLINVPIAFCIGIAALLTIAALGDFPAVDLVAQRMSNGVTSFPLLAIPFFILAGNLMSAGGMARRLVDFASVLVGGLPGGLSYVSTVTCMLFGAISGSATAAVSGVGGIMIPEMQRKGYDRDYSVAVTTTAATTGLIIPPSNIMIVYAMVAGDVSVAAMFMAGIIPGILVGFAILATCWLYRGKYAHASPEPAAVHGSIAVVLRALPSMALMIVVLGGILGGVFSPTEAAAFAVIYALFFSVFVYREVRVAELPNLCLNSGITTAIIFLLIGTSQAMSWILAYQNIPQTVSDLMLSLTTQPWLILFLINVLLLCVGTFMDMTPALLIFTPIFLPVARQLGMDPVHFGVMAIANLCIGLCTPPVGTCLFVGCGVGQTSITNVVRPMLPFYAAMLLALLPISYVPGLSLWLPQLLNLN